MIRSMFKGVMLLFGVCMVIGMVQGIRNPMPQQATKKASPEEEALRRDIMNRAYAVGKTLSKAGAIKPRNEEIDAMSRRMQTEMGVSGSQRWFKQYFEVGFWEGWKGR